jgi:hypothetical protein
MDNDNVLIVNHYRVTFDETFLSHLFCKQQGHHLTPKLTPKSSFVVVVVSIGTN